MNIEKTNTLEILMLGESVTETDTTVYAEKIVLETIALDEGAFSDGLTDDEK